MDKSNAYNVEIKLYKNPIVIIKKQINNMNFMKNKKIIKTNKIKNMNNKIKIKIKIKIKNKKILKINIMMRLINKIIKIIQFSYLIYLYILYFYYKQEF